MSGTKMWRTSWALQGVLIYFVGVYEILVNNIQGTYCWVYVYIIEHYGYDKNYMPQRAGCSMSIKGCRISKAGCSMSINGVGYLKPGVQCL